MHYRIFAYGLCALVLAGCQNVPEPNFIKDNPSTDHKPPTVKNLVAHIDCEIRDAVRKHNFVAQPEKYVYLAEINLSLDVVVSGGGSPSLTYILPWNKTLFNFGASGKYNVQRQRNFVLKYTLDLEKLAREPDQTQTLLNQTDCTGQSNAMLQGDLGMDGIIGGAMESFAFSRYNATETTSSVPKPATVNRAVSAGISQPVTGADSSALPPGVGGRSPTLQDKAQDVADTLGDTLELLEVERIGTTGSGAAEDSMPTFSSQVQFTVAGSASLGPVWSLVNFKGPGTDLISLGRTTTDRLIVSFARQKINDPARAIETQYRQAAAAAARTRDDLQQAIDYAAALRQKLPPSRSDTKRKLDQADAIVEIRKLKAVTADAELRKAFTDWYNAREQARITALDDAKQKAQQTNLEQLLQQLQLAQ